MGIGEHCAVADCNQLDFLPFKCDCCGRTFCLQHRQYAAHSCSAAAGRELEVIACPLCAQGIRLRPGEDANLAFERHAGGECNPANYQKVHNKPRCPAAGCREKLTSINTYACKECGRKVCLKHRCGGFGTTRLDGVKGREVRTLFFRVLPCSGRCGKRLYALHSKHLLYFL